MADQTQSLNFLNAGQEGISPNLAEILLAIQEEMDRQIPINSGYRNPYYNRKVGGSRGSYHTRGLAADLNMGGMDEEDRQKLVRELTQRGVGGMITYDKSPNMLHVDMRDRPDGAAPWFMHNRTNAQMGGAPDWFQESYEMGGIAPPEMVPVPRERGTPSFVRNSPPDAMGINPYQPLMDQYAAYGESRMRAPDAVEGRVPSFMPPIPVPRPDKIIAELLAGSADDPGIAPRISDFITGKKDDFPEPPTQEDYFPPAPMGPFFAGPEAGLSPFGVNLLSKSDQFLKAILNGGGGLW